MGARFSFLLGDKSIDLPASGEATIGSQPDCDVTVPGDKVEGVHAVMQVEGANAILQTRAPEEDVRVNGMPTRVRDLKAGDRVRLGEEELVVGGQEGSFTLDGADQTYPLKPGENVIGRSPDSAIVIESNSISRQHATVVVLPNRALIKDLQSSNGTFVNDERLGQVALKAGDEVEIGTLKLRFAESRDVVGEAPPPVPEGTMIAAPELRLVVGTKVRKLAPGTWRIGRAPDCEVSITNDEEVSRYHAEMKITGGLARVKDLGSSNGTLVNGKEISGEQELRDGDRIKIGQQELLFKSETPADPMGATVLSKDVAELSKTMVAPSGVPEGGPPGSKGAALAALDLTSSATPEEIKKKFQELYSDCQIRLTNAPTQELKKKYQRKLDELRDAFDVLTPGAAPGAQADLPSAEPVHEPTAVDQPQPVPPPPPGKSSAPAAPAAAAPSPEPEPVAAAPAKKASGGGIPKSTWIMAGISAAAVLLTGVLWTLWRSTAEVEADRQEALDTKTTEVTTMQERIPEAQEDVTSLETGKATLLQNAEFKVCNLSSSELFVIWLHSTYVTQDGSFRSFDSALENYVTWNVGPGATTKFNFVKDDEVVWDGSTVFFSLLFQYRGQEMFRSGAWSTIGSDCYNLALD